MFNNVTTALPCAFYLTTRLFALPILPFIVLQQRSILSQICIFSHSMKSLLFSFGFAAPRMAAAQRAQLPKPPTTYGENPRAGEGVQGNGKNGVSVVSCILSFSGFRVTLVLCCFAGLSLLSAPSFVWVVRAALWLVRFQCYCFSIMTASLNVLSPMIY